MKPAQIPIDLDWRERRTFDAFEPGRNGELLERLRALGTGTGRGAPLGAILAWGGPGTGKSHLQAASCTAASERGVSVAYLPLGDPALAPEALAGLADRGLVCLDDVDRRAGDRAWEEALFFLHTRLEAAGRSLFATASRPPAAAGFALPDLASRLGAGLVFRVWPLDDDGRRRVLERRAGERGMALADGVSDYLLARVSRDLETLLGLLDRVDRAALASKRRVTVPLVREVLAAPAE